MMMLDPKQAGTLWAIRITGPDDIIPVAGYLDAVRAANAFNAWWQAQKTSRPLHEFDPRMWAAPVEWDGDPERHAEWVANPSPDYTPFITPPLSTVTPAEVGGLVGAQTEARAIAEAARRLVRNTIDAIAVEELVQDRVAAALGTQAAELVAVKAKNENLCAAKDHWEKQARDGFDASLLRGLELDTLRAALAEARKALEPFGRIADAEDFAGTKDGESVFVNVSLCRAARRVREQGGE